MLCCFLAQAGFPKDNSTGLLQQTVDLNVRNKSFADLFTEIRKQTGAVFSYDPQQFDASKKVTVQSKGSLSAVLQQALPKGCTFKASGNYIIISVAKKSAMIGAAKPSTALQTSTPEPAVMRDTSIALKKISSLSSGESTHTCHSSISNKNNEEMKKQITAALLALTMTTAPAMAQETTPEPKQPGATKVFQLSFVYPLGIYGTNTPQYAYGLSLNVLGGVTGGVSGAEFAGLYNINRYNVNGAQFAGLANVTSGTFKGGQFAGLANVVSGPFKGAQAAGLINLTGSSLKGAQVAGLVNVAGNAVNGAQVAGLANVTAGSVNGIQIAGIGNRATDSSGVQVAGIVNVADTMKTQIAGIVNIANRGGFQLGIVNVRDTADGCMLGIVNIARRGGVLEFEAGASEFFYTSLSFRSGVKRLYSIINISYNFKDEFWAYGFGVGTTFEFSQKFGMNLELMEYTLTDKNFSMHTYNILAQLRPLVYYRLSQHLRLFAGPAFNLYIGDNTVDNPLSVTTPYTIASHYDTGTKLESWIGGTAGIRFNF